MPILDTNLLVHHVQQDGLWQIVEARYGLLNASTPPIISIATEGEIRALALQFDWGARKQQMIEALMAYLIIVPLPFANVVETYAEIDDYSKRNGVPMGKNDLWIAATAAVTRVRLLTTDRDFDHLDGVYLDRDWLDPVLA